MATKLKVTGVVGANVLDPKGQHIAYDEAAPTSTTPTTTLTLEEALPAATADAQRTLKVKLDAITTTVDRSAVDQAEAAAKVADKWLAEAESAKAQAVEAYQTVLTQPFATFDAFIKATEPLVEQASQADDALIIAKGRAQALRAKAVSLEAEYNAMIHAKQQDAINGQLGDVTKRANELTEWFIEKCMHALKVTRGATAQPGPDVLSEYGTKFTELTALKEALAGASGSTASVPALDNPLTPEKVARMAWFSGETQNNPMYEK